MDRVASNVAWSVNGKVVFITGAARGIGAESARQLARAGARLALVGFEPDELEKVAAECGDSAIWIECDVTDADALQQAVDQTVERFGGIDVAVANAGIASVGTVRGIDADAWEHVIEVNLLGVFRTIKLCLPHVIERRGYVLPIASVAAAMHTPGMSAYAATKAGVEALGNSLRGEVAHLGVGVGVGYFSWIRTDMVAGADAHPAGALMRKRLRGPLGKTYPVEQAGEAVARGIETKARRVIVPGWARAMLIARMPFNRLGEISMRRYIPEAVELMEREAEQRGIEASAPVGAGGAADQRAHQHS